MMFRCTRIALFSGIVCALIASAIAGRGDGLYVPFSIPATSCTSQFIRSIAAATGVGTCATVGTSDLASSLSLTTPNINVATATSVNKVTITAPATSATLTITDGQTLSYTEGTWTPTFTGATVAGTGQTYTIQVGSYEKIGRQVTARFYITASSLGTATGNLQLQGLPFTSTSTTNDYGVCAISFATLAGLSALQYGAAGIVGPNTSFVVVQDFTATGTDAITVTEAGASAALIGVCNYRT